MFRSLKTVSLTIALFAGLGLAGLGAVGCDDAEDAADEVQELFDCTAICSAYEVCVDDDSFDTTACIDACEENADASDLFEEQAEDCTDCVETDSCDEDVWQCSEICDGITP